MTPPRQPERFERSPGAPTIARSPPPRSTATRRVSRRRAGSRARASGSAGSAGSRRAWPFIPVAAGRSSV